MVGEGAIIENVPSSKLSYFLSREGSSKSKVLDRAKYNLNQVQDTEVSKVNIISKSNSIYVICPLLSYLRW